MRYTPPCFHTGTYSHRPCRTPGKPAGVEHTANEGLNQTGFTRPGRPADCHVEIGIVHSLVEQVDERQLISVGGGGSPAGASGLSATIGRRLATERLSPLHHACRLQLFEQAFAAFERHHGQKITQVMVAGRDKLEATLTVTVEHLLLGSERASALSAVYVVILKK